MARGKWPSNVLSIQAGLQADEARVRGLFKEAKKLYGPKGDFMKGTEATISRGSKRAVASGVQQLASAGLAGTSIVGGLGKKYEEEVGMPARERATSARLGALAGLLQAEAGAELQMSMRPPITIGGGYGGGGGGGGRRTITPRRTTAQSGAATRPQPLPTLNLPTLKAAKREPTGYKGIYFGADYYKRQQQQPQAAPASTSPSGSFYKGSLMQQADPYDISGRYF